MRENFRYQYILQGFDQKKIVSQHLIPVLHFTQEQEIDFEVHMKSEKVLNQAQELRL